MEDFPAYARSPSRLHNLASDGRGSRDTIPLPSPYKGSPLILDLRGCRLPTPLRACTSRPRIISRLLRCKGSVLFSVNSKTISRITVVRDGPRMTRQKPSILKCCYQIDLLIGGRAAGKHLVGVRLSALVVWVWKDKQLKCHHR